MIVVAERIKKRDRDHLFRHLFDQIRKYVTHGWVYPEKSRDEGWEVECIYCGNRRNFRDHSWSPSEEPCECLKRFQIFHEPL